MTPSKRLYFPTWWPLVGALFGCSLSGCSTHDTEVRVQAPPLPPPSVQALPSVRPPPTCAELGIPNEPDQVFEHDGKYCGCHEGKAHCRDTNDKCFHDGVWYDEGAVFPKGQGKPQCTICLSPSAWNCVSLVRPIEYKVTLLNDIHFEIGSAQLPADADFDIQRMIEQLRALPKQRLTLEAHADPNEPEPAKIAQRRAEAVRAVLLKRGVTPQRIIIKNME